MFIMDNLGTIMVSVILLFIVAMIIKRMINNSKRGCSCCCSKCAKYGGTDDMLDKKI